MDNDTIQRTTSNLRRSRAYIILRYTRSSAHNTQHMGFVREHGVYMDFEDVVRELKKIRLAQFEGYIGAASPEQRDQYPFRNRIGELEEDGNLTGWGYSWVHAGFEVGETCACWLWIEKTWVHRREGKAGKPHELSARQLQVLEAEGGIDYVAVGQQRALVLPANAIFDEDTQDFVFYGEGAVRRGRKQI
jgi:hypothetical protein